MKINLKQNLRKLGKCSITIPDNLSYTLSIKIPYFEYRFPIKDYPESDIEFLEMVDSELMKQDFCLRNSEYHSPRLGKIIPAKVTGTLCYARGEDKGLVGDIDWRNMRIVSWSKRRV